MVTRLQLQKMRQDRDELARTFAACIKGQASFCQFDVKCTCGDYVSCSGQMIQDTLIVGLADNNICLDVLGQVDQDMLLDNTICFIEAKNSGKRSAGRISPTPTMSTPASINTESSTYRQKERKHLAG
ncbi:hypothetical protein RRG08_031722 [Elysia crispata]|uniref:Uncharacterized protein n=1 Tax=Elysia crispata TaxID=231223 RepID=A0AAE0ZF08_9GAST|nr:hypothetical protein RRG08_031722 [Elysia crispata]